jgi:hypothetical protein
MTPQQIYLQKNFKDMHKFVPSFILTLLITLFLMSTNGAPVKKKLPAKISIDTSKIAVKKFDANAIKKYKADKDFNYTGEAVGQPSFWERFWNWLWDKILGLFGRIPYGGPIFKYLLLGVAIALLTYIIFKSLGIDAMQLLRGDARKIDLAYSESLENIHEMNFDAEIEKAISQHNFRLAVRLLYLKCLKQLSDKDLIQWQIDKTNAAYVYELADPIQQQTFRLLTRQFEYVWYGNFFIDKDTFGNINLLFQNFKNHLP